MFPHFEKFTLMKHTETTTSNSTGNNAVLYAVTPNPQLSTDGTALDGVDGLRGSGIGAMACPVVRGVCEAPAGVVLFEGKALHIMNIAIC